MRGSTFMRRYFALLLLFFFAHGIVIGLVSAATFTASCWLVTGARKCLVTSALYLICLAALKT